MTVNFWYFTPIKVKKAQLSLFNTMTRCFTPKKNTKPKPKNFRVLKKFIYIKIFEWIYFFGFFLKPKYFKVFGFWFGFGTWFPWVWIWVWCLVLLGLWVWTQTQTQNQPKPKNLKIFIIWILFFFKNKEN